MPLFDIQACHAGRDLFRPYLNPIVQHLGTARLQLRWRWVSLCHSRSVCSNCHVNRNSSLVSEVTSIRSFGRVARPPLNINQVSPIGSLDYLTAWPSSLVAPWTLTVDHMTACLPVHPCNCSAHYNSSSTSPFVAKCKRSWLSGWPNRGIPKLCFIEPRGGIIGCAQFGIYFALLKPHLSMQIGKLSPDMTWIRMNANI